VGNNKPEPHQELSLFIELMDNPSTVVLLIIVHAMVNVAAGGGPEAIK